MKAKRNLKMLTVASLAAVLLEMPAVMAHASNDLPVGEDTATIVDEDNGFSCAEDTAIPNDEDNETSGIENAIASGDRNDTTELPAEDTSGDTSEDNGGSSGDTSEDNCGGSGDTSEDNGGSSGDASEDNDVCSDGTSEDGGDSSGDYDEIIEVPVEDTVIDNTLTAGSEFTDQYDYASDWNIWYHDTYTTNSSMIPGKPQYISTEETVKAITTVKAVNDSKTSADVMATALDQDDPDKEQNQKNETVGDDDPEPTVKHTDHQETSNANADDSEVLMAVDNATQKNRNIFWMIPVGFAVAALAVGEVLLQIRKKKDV